MTDLTQPTTPDATDQPRCPVTSDTGLPCQKHLQQMSNGEWLHGGGHWWMPDNAAACLADGHYDATDILSGRTTTHLNIPCPRIDTAHQTAELTP